MVSTALASTLARRSIHYGWVVVAATFSPCWSRPAAMGAPGVLIKPLQDEFGWETSQISSALAVRLLLFGLMGPFSAAFMNYFGVRKVIVFAMVLISSGFVGSLFADRDLAAAVALGHRRRPRHRPDRHGTGRHRIGRWFTSAAASSSACCRRAPPPASWSSLPLMAQLTEDYGWRATVFFVCGMILLAALVVLAFMRDRPSDLNLPSFGEDTCPPPARTGGLLTMLAAPIVVLGEISKTSTFWILFATFFICSEHQRPDRTHFVTSAAISASCGGHATSVLAVMGIFDFFGTIGSGWLSDRFRQSLAALLVLRPARPLLLYLPFSDFSFGLSIFAVFYGLDWIATVPPTVKLAAETLREGEGRHRLRPGLHGPPAGRRHRRLWRRPVAHRAAVESYLPAFFIAGAFCLLASILAITLKKSGLAAPAASAAH